MPTIFALKYSHLEPKIQKRRMTEVSDEATQEPGILNNSTQTIRKDMVDKETDTHDELKKYWRSCFDDEFK